MHHYWTKVNECLKGATMILDMDTVALHASGQMLRNYAHCVLQLVSCSAKFEVIKNLKNAVCLLSEAVRRFVKFKRH